MVRWKYLVRLVVLAMACFMATMCSISDPVWVKYEVTGTASSVDITMHNSGGNVEQLTEVSVPWFSNEFMPRYKDIEGHDRQVYLAYISAQNNGDSGSVTVRIYKDGRIVEEATSKGAYVTATAQTILY